MLFARIIKTVKFFILIAFSVTMITACSETDLNVTGTNSSGDNEVDVLGVPANVSATDGTLTDHITVTWTAVADTDFYNVYRKTTEGGDWSPDEYLMTTVSGTSWNDTTANAGTLTGGDPLYYYRVKAYRSSDDLYSAFSAANSGIRAYSYIDKISGVDASDYEYPGYINIKWNKESRADVYEIWRHTSDTTKFPLAVKGATNLLTPTLLTLTEANSTIQVGMIITGSGLASGTTIIDRSNDPIFTLSQNVTASNSLVSFNIYETGNITDGSAEITDVKNIGAYEVGCSISGEGIPTGSVIGEISGSTISLEDINGNPVLATIASSSTVQLSIVKSIESASGTLVESINTNTYIDDLDSLDKLVNYYYQIVARNTLSGVKSLFSSVNVGNSAPSNLDFPLNVSATEGATGKIDIDWSDVSGADMYNIYRKKITSSYGKMTSGSTTITNIPNTSILEVGWKVYSNTYADSSLNYLEDDVEIASITDGNTIELTLNARHTDTTAQNITGKTGTFVIDSTSITVDDASSIDENMTVSGSGIVDGTVVTGIAGNILTVSNPSSAAGTNVDLTFTKDTYSKLFFDNVYDRKCNISNGSAIVTAITITEKTTTFNSGETTIPLGDTSDIVENMIVTGTGIPTDTTVTAIVTNTSITISSATSTAGSDVTLSFKNKISSNLEIGLDVYGDGIRADTTLSSLMNDTTIVLTEDSTKTQTGITITITEGYELLTTVSDSKYEDTDIDAGQLYLYRIQAVSSPTSINSSFSDQAKGWAEHLPIPTVANVTATDGTSTGDITVSFDQVVGEAEYYYNIYRKAEVGGTYALHGTINKYAPTFEYIDSFVSPDGAGVTYYYKVKVANSAGGTEGADSNYDAGWIMLATPTDIVASTDDADKIVLEDDSGGNWIGIGGADNYEIYRSLAGADTYTKIGETGNTIYEDATALGSTDYDYKIRANKSGTSIFSDYSAVTTGRRKSKLPSPEYSAAPGGVQPYTVDQTITLTVAAPNDDATIYYTTNGDEPTTGSSSIASGGTIAVTSATVLKTFSAKTDWFDSDVATINLRFFRHSYGWTKQFSGASNITILDIEKERGDGGSENIYMVGYFKKSVNFQPSTTTYIKTATGVEDAFIAKYDSSGTLQWVKTIGATGEYCVANAVTMDLNDNLLFTGYFTGTVNFDTDGGTDNSVSAGQKDIFVTKIDNTGTYVDTITYSGTSDGKGIDVKCDSQNNIYLYGTYMDGFDFNDAIIKPGSFSNGSSTIYITNTSSIIVGMNISGTGIANGSKVTAIDTDTSITTSMTTIADGGGGETLRFYPESSSGSSDLFITKISSDFSTPGWTYVIGGSEWENAGKMEIDSLDNIYLTGDYKGTVNFKSDWGDDVTDSYSATSSTVDAFILKIKTDGTYLYTKSFGGEGSDSSAAVAAFNRVISSGTSGTAATSKLVGSGTFWSKLVKVGDLVVNTTDNTTAVVTAIDSDTALSLSADIFATGETFDILYAGAVSQSAQCDIPAANKLIDKAGTSTWLTTVKVGDLVINIDTSSTTIVTVVDDDTNLTIKDDIFQTDDKTYKIISSTKSSDNGTSSSTPVASKLNSDGTPGWSSIVDNGDIVINKTTGESAYVTVVADSSLTIDSDIFTSADQGYEIIPMDEKLYITGSFAKTVDFNWDAGTDSKTTSNDNSDSYLLSMSQSGDYIETKKLGGDGFEDGNSIDTDKNGNIYIAGKFNDAVTFAADWSATDANDPRDPSNAYYIFLTKINSDFSYGWTQSFGALTGGLNSSAEVVVTNDFIFHSGIFMGSIDFGTGSIQSTSASVSDLFISKLDTATGLTDTWTKTAGILGSMNSKYITKDSSNNIYVIGSFTGIVDFKGGTDTTEVTGSVEKSSGFGDIYISKFDNTGAHVWTTTFGDSTSDDEGYSLAVDGSAVLSVGKRNSNAYLNRFDSISNVGSLTWTNTISTDVESRKIIVDGSSNVYIAGYFAGTVDFDTGAGTDELTTASQDGFIASYVGSDGVYRWSTALASTAGGKTNSIALNTAGSKLYTTGIYDGSIFIKDYDSSDGTKIASSLDITLGADNSMGNAIAVDSSDNVYLAGSFAGTSDVDFYYSGDSNKTKTGDITIATDSIAMTDTTGIQIGMIVTISGTGIPSDTTVTAIVANSSITISKSATETNTGETVTFLDERSVMGGQDAFIMKINSDNTYGWTKTFGGYSDDTVYGMVIDSDNIYVTGIYSGFNIDFARDWTGIDDQFDSQSTDMFITRIDADGGYAWTKSIGGSSVDYSLSLVLYSDNNSKTALAYTGLFGDTVDFDITAGTDSKTEKGFNDAFISSFHE